MRLLIGFVLGAALVYGATAYAGSSHRAAFPSPHCKYSRPTSWVCAFPDPKSLGEIYEVQVPGLDLTCDLRGALKGFTDETFDCSRSSRRIDACTHGVFGSLSVDIQASALVVGKPMGCIPVNDPFGYTYSGTGGQSYRFFRSP